MRESLMRASGRTSYCVTTGPVLVPTTVAGIWKLRSFSSMIRMLRAWSSFWPLPVAGACRLEELRRPAAPSRAAPTGIGRVLGRQQLVARRVGIARPRCRRVPVGRRSAGALAAPAGGCAGDPAGAPRPDQTVWLRGAGLGMGAGSVRARPAVAAAAAGRGDGVASRPGRDAAGAALAGAASRGARRGRVSGARRWPARRWSPARRRRAA